MWPDPSLPTTGLRPALWCRCSPWGFRGRVPRRSCSADIIVAAVEPSNAAILSGRPLGHHVQQGIGDGLIPEVLRREIIDDVIIVTDEEAVSTARRLAREEGLFVGVSSGTNVAAAIKLLEKLGPGKSVVTLLPDNGERYLSTGLF